MIRFDHKTPTDHAARVAPKSPNTPVRFCEVCHREVVRRVRRKVANHPPVNGCTIAGPHPCILTTGRPVSPVVQ